MRLKNDQFELLFKSSLYNVGQWLRDVCGMCPLLVLLSPCFRENVVVTCKIGSFLCSLDNLLQKNVIVFFFWKSNLKMALI